MIEFPVVEYIPEIDQYKVTYDGEDFPCKTADDVRQFINWTFCEEDEVEVYMQWPPMFPHVIEYNLAAPFSEEDRLYFDVEFDELVEENAVNMREKLRVVE